MSGRLSGLDFNSQCDVHGQPLNRAFHAQRLIDRGAAELIGLCKGMIADKVVNQAEADVLLNWLNGNRAVADQWPAKIIYARVYEFLRDGVLDGAELAELYELLQSMVGGAPIPGKEVVLSSSLPLNDPQPEIRFRHSVFCITGRFAYGSRREVSTAIKERGGELASSVSGKVQYLVVGTLGSRDWIQESWGRKIEKAIELRDRSSEIAIIGEDHWAGSLVR